MIVAITKVHNAKRGLDEAQGKKLDTAVLSIALHDARTTERHAVRALDAHKLEHKCANIAGKPSAR